MPLLERVRHTLRRHRLAAEQTRVAVAVSGGSDSVALLCLLAELGRAGHLIVAGVVHYNHQLRQAADLDEAFCAELARRLGVPFAAGRDDVAALAATEGRSIEDAARTARHAFFAEAAIGLSADVVALGHTRDDQAETFLLRMLRGAGARGLAGMHPKNGLVIRPLLDCRRAELQHYLVAAGIEYRTDETNVDVGIPRNRVRAELIPQLEQRFNPAVVDALAREALILQEQHAYLTQRADEWLAQSSQVSENRRIVGLDRLMAAPAAIRRAALWQAMKALAGGRTVSFMDVERAIAVALAGPPRFDGPGVRVERIGTEVVLTGRPAEARGRWLAVKGDRSNLFEYPLSIPGEVRVPGTGARVCAEMAESWSGRNEPSAVVAVQVAPGMRLAVRNRRPGDRFQPLGLGGRKKLHDFFIDRKVLRERRDEVPLVVDQADRIVWVAGHAIDDAFRVKDPAQSVIILRLKGVGGSV